MRDIKEKSAAKEGLKEKAKAVPKELVHKGVERGVEQMRVQLRDAAKWDRRDEGGEDRSEGDVPGAVSGMCRKAAEALVKKAREDFKETRAKKANDPDSEAVPGSDSHAGETTDVGSENIPASDPHPKSGPDFGYQTAPKSNSISSPTAAKEKALSSEEARTAKTARSVRSLKAKEHFVPIIKAQRVKTLGTAVMDAPRSPHTIQSQMLSVQTARQKTEQFAQTSAKTLIEKSAHAAKTTITSTRTMAGAAAAGGWVAVLIIMVVVLFGGVLSLMGGGNASAALPVSAEVEAYEPLIRQCATEYGIPEYVELIKAVMMQESGGQGSDPMQASESGYNTRYPNTPGGITDPEYSIQCGIQTIRDVLERAGVESPLDMEHIKLALQGYNYGPGYITWAVSNYGGYSLSNAEEFSTMMAERMGWSRYGDTQYVPHVLRYYIFGRVSTGTGNEALVQIALSQEGNGGETYWRWYGFDSRVEWCACFVSWCTDQCGLVDAGTVPKFSLCSDGAAWFARRGQLMDGSYVPSPGDIIFFDWGSDGSINHVGIVEYVADGKVYTIEGNSGDRVKRKSYSLGSLSIYGYGIAIS